MGLKNMSVTKKVLAILMLVSLIFISLIFVGKAYYIPKVHKAEYKKSAQRLAILLNKELHLKEEVGKSNVAGISSNSIVINALKDNKRTEIKKLFKYIGKHYKANTNFKNIKLQLHTADLKSFYRSWNSKKFGDDISFRTLIKKVNQNKKALVSIDLTRTGIKMVAAIPIFDKGKFLGTLEFIQGLNSIQKGLKKNGIDFLFLMDKDKLSVANQIKNPTMVSDYVLSLKSYDKKFLKVAKYISYRELKQKGYVIYNDYFISYKDVVDANGQKVGIYLISQKLKDVQVQSAEIINLINTFVMFIIVLLIIVLFIVSFVFYNFATKPITKAVETITSSSQQIIAASNEVASSSTMLAQSSSSQAASVEEISATIEQTSTTIEQTANNSREADILSSDANKAAQDGYEYIQKLLVSMDEITDSSKEIANIIKTIDEIAFQTNLLALNAAVEAARAGEHGLGFAVVADEVRNLAGKSANAAKETATIIEDSLSQIQKGNAIASDTNKAFEEIMAKIKKSSDLVSEISLASKEQTEGIKQINKAMTQIDEVTQTIASTSEQSAAASEELNAQAVSMGEIITSVGKLVGYNNATLVQNVSQKYAHTHINHHTPVKPKVEESTKKPEDILPLDDDDMEGF